MTTAKLTRRFGFPGRSVVLSDLSLQGWRAGLKRLALVGAFTTYGVFSVAAGGGIAALLLLSNTPSTPRTIETALPVTTLQFEETATAQLSFRLDEVEGGAHEASYTAPNQRRIQALRFYGEEPEAAPEPAAAPPPAPVVAEDGTILGERVLVAEDGTVIGQRITAGKIDHVNITFYDCLEQGFCGVMYNGSRVYEGAAACSWNLPLGTRFFIHGDPTGRIYTCADRGMLTNTWVDIFWHNPEDGWAWQNSVGRYATIEIVN